MSDTEQLKNEHRLLPINLVAPADIEHLGAGEVAHQFHLATMLLEEENARHAAAVKSLQDLVNELQPRVLPVDRNENAGSIREIVRLRRGVAATAL